MFIANDTVMAEFKNIAQSCTRLFGPQSKIPCGVQSEQKKSGIRCFISGFVSPTTVLKEFTDKITHLIYLVFFYITPKQTPQQCAMGLRTF